ncbi:OLC1v1036660C1 [Oldenlandia corymbosa var. corymbosa]|uniref:OLC1v1036660C1 n=1 Tax=Oldenlandia corymbosa var. corymbosa TaxID=529605 RepID=A0AAV1CX61_OLDCO|nr:OLC1v1036660C1 [Oldenlandia corymbosa var. corymbosa]
MAHVPQQYQQEGGNQSTKSEIAECVQSELKKIDISNENGGSKRNDAQEMRADTDAGANQKDFLPPPYLNAIQGEVNMEASISADDVVRAGGFGARDDISSCLPVASDFTDFEASLLDARDYEEPQEEISRPGLGWANSKK